MSTSASGSGSLRFFARFFALSCVGLAIVFLINNYLIFWQDWPGAYQFISSQFVENNQLEGGAFLLGGLQLVFLVLLLLSLIHI